MQTYTLGFKFRIYPNKTQRILINKILGCTRFVYNHFLSVRKEAWGKDKKSISYKDTSAMLTQLKKQEECQWLKEADSMALQESLKDLDTAYKNFFKHLGQYPRFKSKHNHTQSYRTRNQKNGIRLVGNKVLLPKVGLVKIKLSRDFDGRTLHTTVSHTASAKYFVSLCVEVDVNDLLRLNEGHQIGIDVGLKEFLTDSNGNKVHNPKPLHRLQKKLRRVSRNLSKKVIGSKNRAKARILIAKLHEKIGNCRKDFLHKLTTKLVKENQLIAIEDLKVKNMLRNHKLAKSIADTSWSEFFRQLDYKAKFYGTDIVKIDTFYPSSQICSHCGYQNKEIKDLKIRHWVCPNCRQEHDRDINAAKNILNKALEIQ